MKCLWSGAVSLGWKKTKIGSTNVHVLRWFYKCHCSVCVALCRCQPYLFCVWKTSLTWFDVKHKDRQYYRLSLQEMTSALWGPLLTIAVRTFPLILDRRCFRLNPSSACPWKGSHGGRSSPWGDMNASVYSDSGLTVDWADSGDVWTLSTPAWPKTLDMI